MARISISRYNVVSQFIVIKKDAASFGFFIVSRLHALRCGLELFESLLLILIREVFIKISLTKPSQGGK